MVGIDPDGSDGKEFTCNGETQFEKIPWRREWLPTPVFLPGELHGQRSLANYTVHGVTELDTTKQLTLSFFLHFL